MRNAAVVWSLLFATFAAARVAADEAERARATALAKKSQNPVANLISFPFQNNFNFGLGETDRTELVLDIQPVIPLRLSPDWKVVVRTILPLVSHPIGATERVAGVGDTTLSFFVSPAEEARFIWGIGPAAQLPTATEAALASDKLAVGPTGVAVLAVGPWVVGILAHNLWSVDGSESTPDINALLVQPFINYNLGAGLSVATAPVITANWESDDGRLTLPLGAGVNKVFLVGGRLPVQLNLHGYRNALHPDGGTEWNLRVQFAFLVPAGT